VADKGKDTHMIGGVEVAQQQTEGKLTLAEKLVTRIDPVSHLRSSEASWR